MFYIVVTVHRPYGQASECNLIFFLFSKKTDRAPHRAGSISENTEVAGWDRDVRLKTNTICHCCCNKMTFLFLNFVCKPHMRCAQCLRSLFQKNAICTSNWFVGCAYSISSKQMLHLQRYYFVNWFHRAAHIENCFPQYEKQTDITILCKVKIC